MKKGLEIFIGIIFATGTIIWGIHSFQVAEKDFFAASFEDILAVVIAVLVTFFLTERLNDKRKLYEYIEHMILEIEELLDNDKIFYDDNRKIALALQRSCASKIKILKEANISDFSDDFEKMENEFHEIRDLYSNHYTGGRDDLLKLEPDFNKHKINITDKCDRIRLQLYKKK